MNGSALQEVPIATLRNFKIALPPTSTEQAAIAEALSDVDVLIESMEQLLAKKLEVKQGTAHDLLTGHTRLPGFSDKWTTSRLDELGRWTGGMTPSMANMDFWRDGSVPWVSSGDMKATQLKETGFNVSDFAIKQNATTLVPARSILIVTRSGILRNYLPVAINVIPMAINQDIKALIPNEVALPEYLLQSIIHFGDEILARCLKSGTTVESIEFPWLKAFEVPIPTRPEQAAIATVLGDMDAEISDISLKLAKARQIKQAMMQELLTGRIRLM